MATQNIEYITIRALDETKEGFHSVRTGLGRVALEAKATEKATGGAGVAMAAMGKRAGMAGIQIQQFVGQVQGGTNAFTALSMQAADLGFVLGFPLAGAIAGITASFAGPLLEALTGATGAIEKQAEAIRGLKLEYDELGKAEKEVLLIQKSRELKQYAEEYKALQRNIDDLNTTKYREVELNNGVVVTTDEVIEKTQKDKEQVAALKAQQEGLNRQMENTRTEMAALSGATSNNTDGNNKLTSSFETLDDQLRELDALTIQHETSQERLTRKMLAADEVARKFAGSEELVARMQKKAVEEFIKAQGFVEKKTETEKKSIETSKELVDQVEDLNWAYQDVADRGIKSMEDGLVGLVNGTMSAKDAFRNMALSIVNDLIRMQIQQSITSQMGGFLSGLFGGGVTSDATSGTAGVSTVGGAITPFQVPIPQALGGSVKAGQAYTVGEHGRETFIPSTDGQIVPNGGGEGVTINQTIQISTGVSQTVRAEIAQLMPQITNATKAAVADARQRGGGFSKSLVGA